MSADTQVHSGDDTVSQTAKCDHIPVIDLSALDSPVIEERCNLAEQISEASTKVGFFYIKVSPHLRNPRTLECQKLSKTLRLMRISSPPFRTMVFQMKS